MKQPLIFDKKPKLILSTNYAWNANIYIYFREYFEENPDKTEIFVDGITLTSDLNARFISDFDPCEVQAFLENNWRFVLGKGYRVERRHFISN